MTYPEKLLRGISNLNFIDQQHQIPTPELFPFKEDNDTRNDGYIELSINWYDDEGAVKQLFNQRKDDGSFQFSVGLNVLVKKQIDLIKNKYHLSSILDYERQPLEDNKYHGNLLLKKDVEKNTKRTIIANLAVSCHERIIQRS